LILYPVLRSLEAKGGSRGVLEMFPNVGKSPEGGSVCPPRSQNWREFWQTEYAQSMENMFLILYPVVRSLEAKGGSWGGMEMFPNVGKSPEGGSVCPLMSHIWGDFWPRQWTESMKNMFMVLYPVLESLGANGGSWGGMEMSPNVGDIPKMRKICTQRSQNWGYLWPTEYAEFIEKMLLMLYPVLESLSAKRGPWGAEMQWKFPPMWEYRPRGTYLYTKESVLGGFLANKMHRMHEEHVLDVLSSAGVARGKGCYLGC